MIRFARIAVLAFLLAGCAAAPLTPTTELGADSGALVLRLTTNVAPAGFSTVYDTVQVVSDTGIYTLTRQVRGVVRTGLFSGALPAGRYRVSRFETVGFNFRRWVDVPAVFGTFTVQAGQLTDLGTVIYEPAGGNKVLFARTLSESDTRELVAASYPKLAERVLAQSVLGWDAGASNADLDRTFAAMRARVAPINFPVVAGSGSVYAGSALGQVLARPAGQRSWRQFDTGTAREILSVIEDGSALLAGGEEGFLVRSTDGGRSWQRMQAPDRGAILHLVRRPGAGLMVVSLFDKTVTVWEQAGAAWQTRGQFPYERSFNAGALPPHAVDGPRHLYVGLPNGVIHALDFASGQWQRHEAPFSLITLATAGDMLYGYGAQLTHSIWMSEDNGKTWRDLDTSRRAGAPVFSDPRTGYVLYVKEVFAGKMSVQMTKDGGRSWSETGDLPEAAARRVFVMRPMAIHPDGPTLLVFATNGAVFSTRDAGATWTEERRGAF